MMEREEIENVDGRRKLMMDRGKVGNGILTGEFIFPIVLVLATFPFLAIYDTFLWRVNVTYVVYDIFY